MSINQPLPELTDQLKKLKLTGFLNNVSIRNQEAINHHMAYSEYLSLLLQDELLFRENRRYERLLKQAGINGYKTIENFDFKFNPKVNQALIKELATGSYIREKNPVLIVGPCGTGKSHIAQGLGFCAIKQGYNVICTNQNKILQILQSAKATGNYNRKLNILFNVQLLIIDDFGLKPLRTPEDEALHELVVQRYERSATILTSNLALSEWQQAFPNQLLGAATVDRLQHNAYVLVLEGTSYRSNKIKIKQSEEV